MKISRDQSTNNVITQSTHQSFDLLDGPGVDERSLSNAGLHAITQLDPRHGRIQLLHKSIVDGRMDQKPIAADARLRSKEITLPITTEA